MYDKILRIFSRRKKGSILRRKTRYASGWERLVEESLRERHDPLQDAWDQYQILLAMYKMDEGIEDPDPDYTDEPGPW